MTMFAKQNDSECAKAFILTLKGQLPPLDLAQNIDIVAHEYREYFQFYNFAQLDGLYEQFHFGALSLAGYSIATYVWRVPNPRAQVFVTHGLFDHIALYLPLVAALLRQRYTVIAIDLPEHGLSSGTYGTLDSFDTYVDVVDACFAYCQPHFHAPWFAVGQSTGAGVLLKRALVNKCDVVEKLVVFAPLIFSRARRKIEWLHRILSRLLRMTRRKFTINSNDADFCYFLKHEDPLQPRSISVLWVGAMIAWGKEFLLAKPSDMSVLMVQGTADATVDFRYNMLLLPSKFPKSKIVEIEGAMHHIVREADPWQSTAFTAMLDFFEGKDSF